MHKKILVLILISALLACSNTALHKGYRKLSVGERQLADSMLLYALDHEALYTLVDTLKPISSVKFLPFKLAKDSTIVSGTAQVTRNFGALDTISMYQRICRRLSHGDIEFVLVPFAQPDRGTRNMEIYAVRKSKMAQVLASHASFFGQFGITPNMPPATVLPLVEYENRYDRWRAYGYLFGYPDYAVDFFTTAGKQQDSTKEFVKRSFFHIPVYAATSGYFTYAMPQNHTPGPSDSALRRLATNTLEQYKKTREPKKLLKKIRL